MKVCVYGVGLIGGSIASGLVESGYAETVLGYDVNPDHLDIAFRRRLIHGVLEDLSDGGAVDLWVMAVPPSCVLPALQEVLPHCSGEASFTDVASTKSGILDGIPDSLRSRFVGGHPIAGTEHRGPETAACSLFLDRPWVLTPTEEIDPKALKRVQNMVFALDAVPVMLDAKSHDQHFAMLSHIPNALASILLKLSGTLDQPQLAGGSFQDMTRVGGASPHLWADILVENRDEVLRTLDLLRAELDDLEESVRAGDGPAIARLFEKAAAHRLPPRTENQ